MPYSMVHLTVSVKLFEHINQEVQPEFLLGSIAPDSIHMRENASKEEKNNTHLNLIPINTLPSGYDIIEHCRTFLNSSMYTNSSCRNFILGYLSHVLTDVYWLRTIHKQFKEKTGDKNKTERRALYSLERLQADINLYNRMKDHPLDLWKILEYAPPVTIQSFLLTQDEIQKYKDYTIKLYSKDNDPKINNEYISDSDVTHFISFCVEELLKDFTRMDVKFH